MAERKQPIVLSGITDSYDDYTGTPNNYAPDNVEAKMIIPPVTQKRGFEELMVNSSSKMARYASVDLGLVPGTTYEVTYVARDPKNNTDTALVSLLRGLMNNDLSGTGFSGWTTTNPNTGAGKATLKHKPVLRDDGGTSHTMTIPVNVTDVAYQAQGEHLAIKATLTVVGAITVA